MYIIQTLFKNALWISIFSSSAVRLGDSRRYRSAWLFRKSRLSQIRGIEDQTDARFIIAQKDYILLIKAEKQLFYSDVLLGWTLQIFIS